MRDRDAVITHIADLLPEVMRSLTESHPLTKGDWTLTLAQLRALPVIGAAKGCTMGSLARSLGISLSAATGLVDRLISHGLVERVPDPKDRRLVHVRLSAKGRRARRVFQTEKKRHMVAALSSLSARDLESIAASLVLLHGAFRRARGRDSELSSQEQDR